MKLNAQLSCSSSSIRLRFKLCPAFSVGTGRGRVSLGPLPSFGSSLASSPRISRAALSSNPARAPACEDLENSACSCICLSRISRRCLETRVKIRANKAYRASGVHSLLPPVSSLVSSSWSHTDNPLLHARIRVHPQTISHEDRTRFSTIGTRRLVSRAPKFRFAAAITRNIWYALGWGSSCLLDTMAGINGTRAAF